MTFREQLEADLYETFFNLEEFGQHIDLDG